MSRFLVRASLKPCVRIRIFVVLWISDDSRKLSFIKGDWGCPNTSFRVYGTQTRCLLLHGTSKKEIYAQGEAVPACIFSCPQRESRGSPLAHQPCLQGVVCYTRQRQKECRGGSVFRWTTDLTTIFAAVGEI